MASTNQSTVAAGTGSAPTPADFGVAGKLTVRTDMPATAIHLDHGEFLSYDLTVHGVEPIFTFACKHRKLKTDEDFPAGSRFQWTHFQTAGGEDAHDDTYTVGVSFLGAPIKYTLVVKRCGRDGATVQTLKDSDVESTDPSDFYLDGLRVFSI